MWVNFPCCCCWAFELFLVWSDLESHSWELSSTCLRTHMHICLLGRCLRSKTAETHGRHVFPSGRQFWFPTLLHTSLSSAWKLCSLSAPDVVLFNFVIQAYKGILLWFHFTFPWSLRLSTFPYVYRPSVKCLFRSLAQFSTEFVCLSDWLTGLPKILWLQASVDQSLWPDFSFT